MTRQVCHWEERAQGQAIQFEGGAKDLRQGCTVDLEHNGVRINVQIEKGEKADWTGKIIGFPNNTGKAEVGTLKIGQTVDFQEQHVFRCAA